MKNMEITDIRIKKVASEGKMKAVASVTFDNAFAVHDVKVIEGPEKLFVAMPSRRTPDGEYRDIAHPINSDMRNMLESKVLAAYDAIEDEPAPKQLNNIKDRLLFVICLYIILFQSIFLHFHMLRFRFLQQKYPLPPQVFRQHSGYKANCFAFLCAVPV